MDANQLLSSAVELGLDLLEKRGSFLPYCKAVNADGETIVYTPSEEAAVQASESVRSNVLRDIQTRALVGVAFCHHSRIRLSDSAEKISAIQVALHYRGQPAAVWYLHYEMEGNTARVLEYYTNEADEDLFAGVQPDPV